MGQVLLQDRIGAVSVVSTTQVKLATSRITVGGQQYETTSDLFCSLSSTGAGGLDAGVAQANTLYYLYAIRSGTSMALVASMSSLAPQGFLSWNLISRFMTNGSSQVSYVIGLVDDGTPVGVILDFGGPIANIPNGYLGCDGTTRNRVAFAALFAKIGTAWGAGDGSTTFHLPSGDGLVKRGRDSGTGRDPDRASRTAIAAGGNTGANVGSYQDQATRKNGLGISDPSHQHSSASAGAAGAISSGPYGYIQSTQGQAKNALVAAEYTGVSISAGDNETRMKNAYVEFIIKF